jgi:hypothetical protein
MGDFAPPPPGYESPSDRRRALRESERVTRRGGKEGVQGVRPEYITILPPSRPIKPQTQVTPDRNPPIPTALPVATSQEIESVLVGSVAMASQGGRKDVSDQSAEKDGHGAAPRTRRRGGWPAAEGGKRAVTNTVGLLMAPPAGWGDQGGLVERPSRPKPVGDPEVARLLRQRALLMAEKLQSTEIGMIVNRRRRQVSSKARRQKLEGM